MTCHIHLHIVAHSPLSYKRLIYTIYYEYLYAGGMIMLIQRAFGQRIQALRKEKGLSQEKFALIIEMDRTYYASVEAGRRNISLVNIKKIADGFDIPLSELFSDM